MSLLHEDGRQSEVALAIARGTRRLLRVMGLASLSEVSLRNGRRADLLALGEDGTLVIVEIKSSLADFRADQKWPEYRAACDHLYFAVADAALEQIMPEDAGLILADAYGAAIARPAPQHRLAPATRKMVTQIFARTAAARLHRLEDPDGFLS